jgi:dienelactone hydrolase
MPSSIHGKPVPERPGQGRASDRSPRGKASELSGDAAAQVKRSTARNLDFLGVAVLGCRYCPSVVEESIMADEREVSVLVGDGLLAGTLGLPEHPRGVVVLAQETGSAPPSRRYCEVARRLQQHGLGTLRIELLTDEEEQTERWTRHLRLEEEAEVRTPHLQLEVSVFTERLLAVSAWVKRTLSLITAYFGESTAAAAVLAAAARAPDVAAVVSREGCPDLAAEHLPSVRAPTLLIVDAENEPMLERNRTALRALRCPSDLRLLPGASRLCEQADVVDVIAGLATGWYDRYLPGSAH